MLPDKTVEYDDTGAPKLTLKRTNGLFDIVIEVDGIAPYRGTTAEERQVGIESLNPPTVHAKDTEQLVRSSSRAVQVAIFATPGSETMGAGDLAMIHYRTTRAVRNALREMDEDV